MMTDIKAWFELSSYCNLHCRLCLKDWNLKDGFMDLEYFKKQLIALLDFREFRVKELHLQFLGESTIYPYLLEVLQFISTLKRKRHMPQIFLFTNGVYMTEKLGEQILATGALDKIIFSIDGGSRKSHDWNRGEGFWEKTINNVDFFIKNNSKSKNRIFVGIKSLDLKDKSDPEFERIIRKVDSFGKMPVLTCEGIVDRFRCCKNFEEVQNRFNQSTDFDNQINPGELGKCVFIGCSIVYFWDGDISSCCLDHYRKGVVGNGYKSDIAELWPKIKNLESAMEKYGRSGVKLCRDCVFIHSKSKKRIIRDLTYYLKNLGKIGLREVYRRFLDSRYCPKKIR